MTDIVERAQAVLEGVTDGPWTFDPETEYLVTPDGENVPSDIPQNTEFIAQARTLVPELVAEVQRLRAGGAWTEQVEFQRAMKRERDGDCICNHGPDTEGPDEFCPWHGREYRYLVDECVRLSVDNERLREDLAALQRLVRNPHVVAALATVDPGNAVIVEVTR